MKSAAKIIDLPVADEPLANDNPALEPANGDQAQGDAAANVAPTAPAQRELTTRDWVGFFVMVVGMFMAILDIQIVSSSLNEIQAGLAASSDEISWVQTSYLIAEVVMIPLSGYLSRAFSTRLIFTLSAAGFTLSSMLCAFAWDINSMIIFRAVQGFLGGAMIPTVFATTFSVFPPQRRAGLSVLTGLVATMAPTLGPTIGGWITDQMSWHWLFLINLAPGILVTIMVWTLVDFDKPHWNLLKVMDIPGLILMALFLGCLEYVLEEGTRLDWFGDETIQLCTAISAISALLFIWRVLNYAEPIVDLRAFTDRNFALGCLFSFVIGIGLYGSVYLIPLFLAQVRGYKPMQIGIIMFVAGVFQFASAPVAGRLSRVFDPRLVLCFGLAMFGGGVYLQHFLTSDWGYWEFFLPQAVRGFALMFLFMPVNMAALGTLPKARLKNASGLYNLMRNLGGAIGLAGINYMMTERLNLHWSRLVDNMTSANGNVVAFLNQMGQTMDGRASVGGDQMALKALSRVVLREAEVLSFADISLVMALIFFGALLLVPLLRLPKGVVTGEAH
ncbi:MAG TPA: DHA2 family efflux MFS transporter permease subunit [Dongiaceae bacterium]|nr:DHA2 family efflux MFS transporter permease subunit [Dongiaceae bacterium]